MTIWKYKYTLYSYVCSSHDLKGLVYLLMLYLPLVDHPNLLQWQ